MKRILFVELNEDGTVGGSHGILFDLVTRLPSDFEPVVLFYEDNPWVGRLRGEGIEVHVWDARRREESASLAGSRWNTAKAMGGLIAYRRAFIRDADIDMVHLNNSPFQGWDDWLLAARWAGVPCVVYAMGDAHREPSAVKRWFMRQFDRVFPLSRLVMHSLIDNEIPAERMVLTYPGLDLEALSVRPYRPRDEVRDELGVEPGQVLAVMVGNVRRWKGQHVVVEGVGGLSSEQRARLVLLLVGDIGPLHGDYADELRARIAELGIGDTVRFTGRREDVPDLLEAADVAIHASIMPEPFGLVVLEGLTHGCAVVAAGAGGPVEMIDEKAGLLYDPAKPAELTERLARLLDDPEGRARLGAAARVRARDFDIRDHVRLIVETYRELLD
ncbi:MAG: glycosyltransferase family 4 protein [Gemmatimonadetes bacterium]|nr:glycosyltransferase family 4 protein [Gemmatimonadota bacterium]MBT8404794.1 glycosyltransferase family 4 protein [Gemmatimonadota bacterium]NNK62166.1 glycosyltransferase family 4 protein [Gemmatimonadota bacterium]